MVFVFLTQQVKEICYLSEVFRYRNRFWPRQTKNISVIYRNIYYCYYRIKEIDFDRGRYNNSWEISISIILYYYVIIYGRVHCSPPSCDGVCVF